MTKMLAVVIIWGASLSNPSKTPLSLKGGKHIYSVQKQERSQKSWYSEKPTHVLRTIACASRGPDTFKYLPATALCATKRLADMFTILMKTLVRTVHSKSPYSKQGALCVHVQREERIICNSLAGSAPFHALREKSLYLGKMKGLKIKMDYYFRL